jgi:S1-C subfamily serine protease
MSSMITEKGLWALSVFFILGFTAQGQFKYTFTSTPDSAEVFMNGQSQCHTPCHVNYYWKASKATGNIVFEIKANGFQTWSDTIESKPKEFTELSRVSLDNDIPNFDLGENSAVVMFDKLMAEFKEGTTVGRYVDSKGKSKPMNWEGSVKVGDSGFDRRFYEIITSAGINSPYKKAAEMFSDQKDRSNNQLPRYIIGAKLVDYKIYMRMENGKNYGAGSLKSRTKMGIEWQVLDKVSDEVVLTYTANGYANERQRGYRYSGDNMPAFEASLISFLKDSEILNLLKNTKPTVQSRTVDKDTTAITRTIPKPKLPVFISLSEMIRHANAACVTIVTDGGHGSGALVGTDGYVLSAYHVVEGVNKIEVGFGSGLKLDGTILAYDKANDVVLIKIPGSGYQALPMAPEQEVELGEEVLTIGTPAALDFGQSISKGILSGKRLENERIYLQVDMAVSPGNSGGPLLNSKGEVIGVIQSKIIKEGIEGIGFALPVGKAMEVLGLEQK